MIWHDTTVAHLFVEQKPIALLNVLDANSNTIANFATTKIANITERARTRLNGGTMMANEYFKRVTIPADIKLEPPVEDDTGYRCNLTYIEKMMAQVVDMADEVILQALIDFAKENGFTTLFLIDKEFMLSAIKHEIERREKGG